MPEPMLEAFFHLPSHISNSTMYIFNKTSEFLFTLQWSLIKTREPPHRSLCQSGWLFSPLCFARKCLPGPSHMCSVHFKWSVICNEIFDCLIFDGLIWSKSLITWSQSGHKKTFQTLLSSFRRCYQGRKYTLQSKDSYYL